MEGFVIVSATPTVLLDLSVVDTKHLLKEKASELIEKIVSLRESSGKPNGIYKIKVEFQLDEVV